MKSKRIPDDIKRKSIKEAQNEIKEIISMLENKDTDLERSIEKYERMIKLNNHIRELFKQKIKEIRNANLKKTKK